MTTGPKTILISALTVGSLKGTPVKAEFYSGNELYEHCTSPGQGWSLCMGFVAGVFDTMRPLYTCKVKIDQVTLGQSKDIVLRYMTQNPQNRHATAASIVRTAITQAFSCSRL